MTEDPTRASAHAYMDAVIGFQFEGGPASVEAMDLAVRRLADAGAITPKFDGGGQLTSVDISPAVNGAIVPIFMLAFWLAQERGVGLEDVIATLREEYDTLQV